LSGALEANNLSGALEGDLLEYQEKIKVEIQPLGNKLESRNQS
jgi:hypothetical protein